MSKMLLSDGCSVVPEVVSEVLLPRAVDVCLFDRCTYIKCVA